MEKDRQKTVDKVLFCLENNIGEFVSGAYIANNIGVSRNAIWKAVKELRNRGYIIESISNKGYKLEAVCKKGCPARKGTYKKL